MISSRLHQWLSLLVCALMLLKADGAGVGITILEDAVAKGAVCLDGSPPAYHFDKGTGAGVDNWIIHMEGGGWCGDEEQCLARTKNQRGSSKQMEKEFGFSGILGSQQNSNPDFFDWNRIKVRYCDGSSFTGDVEAVNPANKLYFRGNRIFEFIIADLLAKGMKGAKNAILSGCSAGGLASILHCDRFRALLPPSTKVKCISDAGFFIHGKDITGKQNIEGLYGRVAKLHGSVKNLPASCTAKMTERPELCFFPQYVVQTMETPIFLVNSAYDSWQIKNVLVPTSADKGKVWNDCKLDLKNCKPEQFKQLQDYRDQFLSALDVAGIENAPAKGMFIDSCHAHCQTGSQLQWSSDDSPVVSNMTIAKAVGDWYHERNEIKMIDCPYPCNPTCPKVEVEV